MIRLFARRAKVQRRPAAVPGGVRVYAIGDIHGRVDLLHEVHERMMNDYKNCAQTKHVIYLGDYIDRGPYSRDVLETLIVGGPPGTLATHLLGNHEATLLRFLEDSTVGPDWLAFGGAATLLSYGINPRIGDLSPETLALLQRELSVKLPPSHKHFLESLRTQQMIGDYFFVHAGIRPGIPLDQQQPSDLIWIRDQFLESEDFHGKIIVHGHSYETEPEVCPNRIGIDTGAYATGRLTCLVLEGTSRRFL